MATLEPDAIYLLGDNVYNDGIQAGGAAGYGSPFGGSLVDSMADAEDNFLKVHGLLADDGSAGVMFHSYLDILRDKASAAAPPPAGRPPHRPPAPPAAAAGPPARTTLGAGARRVCGEPGLRKPAVGSVQWRACHVGRPRLPGQRSLQPALHAARVPRGCHRRHHGLGPGVHALPAGLDQRRDRAVVGAEVQ
eukprot:scaffold8006_cov113-Isochrysis_galbana.AAC.6